MAQASLNKSWNMSAPLLIADSGPLIALARLDLLYLPGRFFAEVLVTQTVWLEATRKPKYNELEKLERAMQAGVLKLAENPSTSPAGLPAILFRNSIDAGERTALILALESQGALLIDDRRARLAAAELGLPMVGTLGLLAHGRKTGVIGPLQPMLSHLAETGYYLPAEAMAKVLSELGE